MHVWIHDGLEQFVSLTSMHSRVRNRKSLADPDASAEAVHSWHSACLHSIIVPFG